MEFTTNELAAFLDDDFGVECSLLFFGVGATGVPTTIRGRFDNKFVMSFDEVETSGPAVECKTSDVAQYGIKHGSEIIIDGIAYRVSGVQTGDIGFTFLVLEAIG